MTEKMQPHVPIARILTDEERIWDLVKKKAEQAIQELKDGMIVNEAFLKLANDKLKKFS